MDLCRLYFTVFTIMLTSALIVYLLSGTKAGRGVSVFFSDILKECEEGKMKWSQGRFYLMLSLMFYFFVVTLLSIKAVRPDTDIKNESFEMVISALQWIIALFAGYVFGAKGLKVLDSIFKYKSAKVDQSVQFPLDTAMDMADSTEQAKQNGENQKEGQPK